MELCSIFHDPIALAILGALCWICMESDTDEIMDVPDLFNLQHSELISAVQVGNTQFKRFRELSRDPGHFFPATPPPRPAYSTLLGNERSEASPRVSGSPPSRAVTSHDATPLSPFVTIAIPTGPSSPL